MPPMPSKRSVAPMSSGATTWTLREKNRRSRMDIEQSRLRFNSGLACRHARVSGGRLRRIGRRLVPLLLRARHEVTGTTRSVEKASELERAGVKPAVLDVFDREAVI